MARLWFRHAMITWAPWRAKDRAVSKPADRVWVGRKGIVEKRNKMIEIRRLITSHCSCSYLWQLNPSKWRMGPISWKNSPSDIKPKALIQDTQWSPFFQVIKIIKLKHRNSNSFSNDNEIKQTQDNTLRHLYERKQNIHYKINLLDKQNHVGLWLILKKYTVTWIKFGFFLPH